MSPPLLLVIFPILLLLTLHQMYLSSSAVLITTSINGEADREALLAFMEKLVNYSGPALSTWNRSTHFCQWDGVTCSRRHPHRVSALNLSSQGLVGTIFPSIANLTFLRSVDLSLNGLHGEIPSSIGRLHRLRLLDLANNSLLQGEIPVSLENCSNLQYMDLSGNQLQGRIPDGIGTISKLEYLAIYDNSLGGVIPPSIGNISSLRRISLAANNLKGNIPESLGLLASLHDFQVSFNNLSGTIPPSIYNLSYLVFLSAVRNELQGSLPPDLGTHLPNLKFIFLGKNQLTGAIPASISNASMIETIELGNNKISGRIPPELGKLCLSDLNLGRNQLEARDAQDWVFLTSLTNCSRLRILRLNNNRLEGLLPISWANFSTQLEILVMSENAIMGTIPSAIKNLVNLNTLALYKNNFSGFIPKEIGMLQSLQVLVLWENDLSGPIPDSVGNLSQLLGLDVHNNSLKGTIPKSLGNLQQLDMLQLSSNALGGSIPKEVVSLSSLSRGLDLSSNFLVGPLPPEVGLLKNLQIISVYGNKLSGEIPDALGNCQILEYLDLESNFFQGSIPPSLSNLRGLKGLYLSRNNLTGAIPQDLGFIHGLQELHLSHNNLSGLIPEILENLTSLFELDLSFNHFKGQVPARGVFANISAFSIIGNSGLCGGILELHLPACSIDSVKSKRRLSRLTTIVIPIACLILFAATFVLFYWRSKSRKNATTVLFSPLKDKYPKVSFTELLKAADGFASHNLIGMGRYGSVFKGMLSLKTTPNEDPQNALVAVKVFNLQQSGSSKTFIAECEALRMIRHRNIINIKTCCSSIDSKGDDFKALVFDFMPNQSLDRWLHSQLQENHLSLAQRLKIAIGVADALDYLHNGCQPAIVHCDLKPSNILLDSDMSACVGDFGLAKLLSNATSKSFTDSKSSTGIRGTIGYVAPEYGAGEQVSTLGDVYSFGIVLLEMFTGKKPTDDIFKDGLSLHKFVETSFSERVMQIVDPMMLSLEENATIASEMRSNTWIKIKECLNDVIRIGLSCSKHSPQQRMSMKEAAVELRAIRNDYIGIGTHGGES